MRSRRFRATAVCLGLAAALAVLWVVVATAETDTSHDDPSRSPQPTRTIATAPDQWPGDPARWTVAFNDEFDRDQLGDKWGPYSGQPKGDPYSWWDPSHVEVRDGRMILSGYRDEGRWVTGGVSNWPVTQTYGRWEIRFRATASDEITYHFLLWPERHVWPPEIDFLEDFGGPRSGGAAFVHFTDPTTGERRKVQRNLAGVDFTQWQTVGVEWSPKRIKFFVNGQLWDTVTGDAVPDEPMWLGLQSQAGGCQRSAEWGFPRCPQVGTPDRTDIEIDRVTVWSPPPRPTDDDQRMR